GSKDNITSDLATKQQTLKIYQIYEFLSKQKGGMSLQHDNVLVGQYRNVLP
ncbi:MAG: hypothetical protein UT11_C0052G0001, partial [Berkelbacteria bacterium GW2011_GWA2_38_9]